MNSYVHKAAQYTVMIKLASNESRKSNTCQVWLLPIPNIVLQMVHQAREAICYRLKLATNGDPRNKKNLRLESKWRSQRTKVRSRQWQRCQQEIRLNEAQIICYIWILVGLITWIQPHILTRLRKASEFFNYYTALTKGRATSSKMIHRS